MIECVLVRLLSHKKRYWGTMATDLFDMTGRVAIVTGASSGLGVTFAESLAEAGADLSICARRLNKLEQTAEIIRGLGRKCLVVQTDLTQADQVDNMVSKTIQEYGKIDILVNNAGANFPGGLLVADLDFEDYQREIEANSVAPFSALTRWEGRCWPEDMGGSSISPQSWV